MAFTNVYTVAVDRTKCGAGNLGNFPLLISASHASLKSTAHGGDVTDGTNGFDIVVFADGNLSTYVPWEVESWNPVSGTLVIHALCASVNGSSAGSNSSLVVAWGNSAITTQQNVGSFAPANVWDSDYKLVLHMNSNSSFPDSTSNGNNATLIGPASAITGQIDGAVAWQRGPTYSGYVSVGTSGFASGANPFTISFWFAPAPSGGIHYDLVLGNYATALDGVVIHTDGSVVSLGTPGHELTFSSLSGWHHVAFVYDGTNLAIYHNGSLMSGSPQTLTLNTTNSIATVGFPGILGSVFNNIGSADETRVSIGTSHGSPDWIVSEFNNQKNPGNIGSPNFLIWTSGATVTQQNQPQMFVMT